MALATLSIDIEARLAKLEQGLDRAVKLSEQRSKQIENAFNKLDGVAKGVADGLAAYFSVRYFTGLIKDSIDAQDHLNDLSKKAQVSVEQIGGIDFAASQAGGSVDEAAALIDRASPPDVIAHAFDTDLSGTRRWFTSFGSCSVTEPLESLAATGLLEDT